MSPREPSRRELLARGLGAAGAAALPAALLAAESAHAQAEDEGQAEALEKVIKLEQGAALAYRRATDGETLQGEARELAERFAGQESDHAEALEAAYEQLGFKAPEAPSDPAEAPSLEGFGAATSQEALIDFFAEMEEGLVNAYAEAAGNGLDAADLLRTGAQVGASHAQHLVAWRLLRGDSPAEAASLQAGSPGAGSPEDEG